MHLSSVAWIGFIWHQLPAPCPWSFTPRISKSCTWGAQVRKSLPHLPWPPRSAPSLGLFPKNVGDDIAKATCDWKGLRITVRLTTRTDRPRVRQCLLPLPWPSKPPKDWQNTERNKITRHRGIITFYDNVTIARGMRHWSLARELSGTFKEDRSVGGASLTTSWVTATVGQRGPTQLRPTKENISIKDHLPKKKER